MKQIIIITVFSVLMLCPVARAERLAVAQPVANIRSGPGTNYHILWKIGRYHPLFIIKKSDAWYYFRDFEGDEGWVHKSLLGNTSTVITQKDTCNVRTKPGTKYPIAFTVEKGIPFKVIRRKGVWIHVQHDDGDKGWIHRSLVW